MGVFKKTTDPISDRARALNAEIAALESKIKKLSSQTQASEGPRVRSTAFPHGPTISNPTAEPHKAPEAHKAPEPIFEAVDQNQLKAQADSPATAHHFNERGVLKYDLLSLIERIKKYFRGPPLSNPKLINYLAAGSVQGLRPLRYEKRVGRNRFIGATILLVLVLLWVLGMFFRRWTGF